MNTIDYAKSACEVIMNKYSAEDLPPARSFHYHQGVFLSGMEQTYLNTKDRKYFNYIKDWVDSIITPDGVVSKFNPNTLDDKRSATLLFRLLEETGDSRYEKPLHMFRESLRDWPSNPEGGFGHKIYERQHEMWLDGLYMASPLLTMYGAKFGDESCFEDAIRQAKLMWKHNRDEKTGLMYHAWDYSKQREWANPETGCAPEVWGRAMGWYIVALNEMLDYIPSDFKERALLVEYVKEYIAAIVKYQDKDTGLWYQVVDKGYDSRNWIESSCSALFICGIATAIKRGYVGAEYTENVKRGFDGLTSILEKDEYGGMIIPKICIGTGVGSFEFYMERPTVENDLHGMGAFILAANACVGIV